MLLDKAIATQYLIIYKEIMRGQNLHEHMHDINDVITQLEAIIQENDIEPLPLELWEQMRIELYFLKDEILKRL